MKITMQQDVPTVAVLISAYNEEKVITSTVTSILASTYPADKLRIFIGSDCSSDGTNAVLQHLQNRHSRLHVYTFPDRRGKAAVLNDLAQHANSADIFIFADANTKYEPETISYLVQPLMQHSNIGAVGGNLQLHDTKSITDAGNKERSYWEYETFIKRAEGRLGILIGASGGVYALRSQLYTILPIRKILADDFFLSMRVLEQGFDVVFQEKALAHEDVAPRIEGEYRRKVRISSGAWNTFAMLSRAKNPFSLAGWALYSHKVVRWLTPLWLAAIGSAIFFLEPTFWTSIMQLCTIIVVLATVIGWLGAKAGLRKNPFGAIYFLALSVLALAAGFLQFLKADAPATWNSTDRLSPQGE